MMQFSLHFLVKKNPQETQESISTSQIITRQKKHDTVNTKWEKLLSNNHKTYYHQKIVTFFL